MVAVVYVHSHGRRNDIQIQKNDTEHHRLISNFDSLMTATSRDFRAI